MLQVHELDNGALLLTDVVEATEALSMGFWFNHGSRDEGEHERGFSHFLEHMLFKGTAKRDTYQIARDIDRVGGVLNAFTENELTCFYCTLPKDFMALAADVLSDMVFCSRLDRGEIDKEKSVVINEILSYDDLPEQLAHEAFLKGMWGDHPLAWKITGEVEDVRAVSPDRLMRFYRQRYVPRNLVIAAAGNFRTERLIEQLQDFMPRSKTAVSPVRDRRPPGRTAQWEHVRSRSAQVQVYTGITLPREDLPGLYSGQVFSSAVGESMSSRLFQTIREKRALCYSISSYRTLFSDSSLWTVYTGTKPEQVVPLLEGLNAELRRLVDDPLSRSEVDDAKSYLKGSLILSREDMEARMKRLVRLQQLIGKVMEYEESLRYIDEVSIGSVRDFTRKVAIGRNFNLLAYGGKRIPGFRDTAFAF